ncbi:MAG: hypothetical protein LPH21_03660, partial [Shewanella sp.]|nr:hypothetical protein [Shewanella sp.]
SPSSAVKSQARRQFGSDMGAPKCLRFRLCISYHLKMRGEDLMNIHKSSIITFFLGCAFATQAYASSELTKVPFVDSCNDLIAHISKDILDDYIVSTNQIVIDNGYFRGCGYEDDKIYDTYCQFSQAQFYGPDATLLFKNKADGQIVTIRVQQNFCFWEAGNITIKPILGKWVYSTRGGSYGDNQHGNVWLDQVSLNS